MTRPLRTIKSFVLRQSKITPGQQQALNQLMPKFGISYQEQLLELSQVFGRNSPKIVEIGFGMGHATWQMAKNNPGNDYLGIEVHSPGVGSLLMLAKEHAIPNLRIIHHDAHQVIQDMLVDNTVTGFNLYFPDPWPKKRHHKRRIIQVEFIELLCTKLKSNGYIHLATDWEEYAIWMLNVLAHNSKLVNQTLNPDFSSLKAQRPQTKFEERGQNLGHPIWDLIFNKV